MDKNINKLIEILKKEADPDKIILFGSRANGLERKDSDYDICILKEKVEHRRFLAQKLYKSLIGSGLSVDIIVETLERFSKLKLNPFLVYSQIEKNGKLIYEKQRIS